MFTLPDNRIFVAVNTLAMIYNWVDNTETRLPDFPNGVRVNYPWSAGAVLLPLTPEKLVWTLFVFIGMSLLIQGIAITPLRFYFVADPQLTIPYRPQIFRLRLQRPINVHGWCSILPASLLDGK